MIQVENIVESKILLSNGIDSEYAITAYITKKNEASDPMGHSAAHGQISNGKVIKGNLALAVFSKGTSFSISYMTNDPLTQSDVLLMVQAFITEATEFVNQATIIVETEEEMV